MEFDYKILLGILSIIVGIYAYYDYTKDTLTGKTTPHIFTWLTFVIMDVVAFLIQYGDNAGPGSWGILTTGIGAFIILLLALKNGIQNITRSDMIALSLALISVTFYAILNNPFYSQITILCIILFAMYPTFRKSWKKPNEETLSMYSIAGLRSLLSIFASINISFLTIGVPVFVIILNTIFIGMVLLRRRKLDN